MSQSTRDPEKTRSAILDAAEKLFAARGFSGVSMSDVAKEARVTQSLIHHHFGSKSRLWTLVLERMDAAIPPLAGASLDPKAGRQDLESLIVGYFNILRDHGQLARLDAWGKLENPGSMSQLDKQALAQVRDRIAYLQHAGALRRDLAPEHVIIMLQALLKNWWLGRDQYIRWLGVNEADDQADARYLRAIISVVFEGLEPR